MSDVHHHQYRVSSPTNNTHYGSFYIPFVLHRRATYADRYFEIDTCAHRIHFSKQCWVRYNFINSLDHFRHLGDCFGYHRELKYPNPLKSTSHCSMLSPHLNSS
jgi:hypothetical protein